MDNTSCKLTPTSRMSIGRCLQESWKIFAEKNLFPTRKHRLLRLGTSTLFGITALFLVRWACSAWLVYSVLRNAAPEAFTLGETLSSLPIDGLWQAGTALIIALVCLFFFRREQARLLDLRIESHTPAALSRRLFVAFIAWLPVLLVAFFVALQVAFIAMSTFHRFSADLLEDTVAWGLQQDFSSFAVLAAGCWLLLYAGTFPRIASRVLR